MYRLNLFNLTLKKLVKATEKHTIFELHSTLWLYLTLLERDFNFYTKFSV